MVSLSVYICTKKKIEYTPSPPSFVFFFTNIFWSEPRDFLVLNASTYVSTFFSFVLEKCTKHNLHLWYISPHECLFWLYNAVPVGYDHSFLSIPCAISRFKKIYKMPENAGPWVRFMF